MVRTAAAQKLRSAAEDDAGVDGGGHDAEFEGRGEQQGRGVAGRSSRARRPGRGWIRNGGARRRVARRA